MRDEVAAGQPRLRGVPAGRGVRAGPGAAPPPRSEPGSSRRSLAGLRLGLLHGQLKAADKEGVMERFRRGEIQVLVATTVIEVGVDVPEATVMVVEDADRFGIAQLHQLRGRVGRSDRPSWCYLFGPASSPEAAMRLEALERTNRRLRAGRGRPRAAGRGHHPGHAPEGPQRPQAGVAAPRRPPPGGGGPAAWRSRCSPTTRRSARRTAPRRRGAPLRGRGRGARSCSRADRARQRSSAGAPDAVATLPPCA